MGRVHEQRPVEVVVEGHLHRHPDPAGEVVVALEPVLLGLDERRVEDEVLCLFDGLPEWCGQVPVFSHASARVVGAGRASVATRLGHRSCHLDRAAERAGAVRVRHVTRSPSDDALGVALEVLDLLLEGLGVGALDVGHPEADDAVGDALVLEALDAVEVVGVVGDDVHLEVVAGVALLLADLGEPGEQPVELLAVAAGVHPAVALEDGAAQGVVDVAADEQRDLLGRRRALLELVDLVELAVVPEELAGREAAQDVHALVHPLAALGPVDAEVGEVLGPRRDADAEAEPVVGEEGERRRLLGDQHRRPHRQLEHERREPQRRRHREQVGAEHHRLDELLAVEELPVAGVGVGVLRVGVLGVDQAVGHGHARVAGGLRGLRQRCVELRLRHRLGIGEPHGRKTRTCFSFAPSPEVETQHLDEEGGEVERRGVAQDVLRELTSALRTRRGPTTTGEAAGASFRHVPLSDPRPRRRRSSSRRSSPSPSSRSRRPPAPRSRCSARRRTSPRPAEGWGKAHPRHVFNGGDPSGEVAKLEWRHWGDATATGRGVTWLLRPEGGYYARPGRIVLRAEGLGACADGTAAYTRLEFRIAHRPGGPVGRHWRPLGGRRRHLLDTPASFDRHPRRTPRFARPLRGPSAVRRARRSIAGRAGFAREKTGSLRSHAPIRVRVGCVARSRTRSSSVRSCPAWTCRS